MVLGRLGVRIVTMTTGVAMTTVGVVLAGGASAPAAAAATPSPRDPVVVSSSAAGVVGNAPTNTSSVAWSPDGTKVAFSSAASNLVPGDSPGSVDLFVKHLATGAITAAPGWGEHPAWSPDGKSLAYWSGGGDLCVRLMVWTPPANSARLGAEQCGVAESFTHAPVWAPTSKRFAGEIEITYSRALWTVDLSGATPSSETSAARWPTWSSGGTLALGALVDRGIEPVGERPIATSNVTVGGAVLWPPVKLSDEFGCPDDGCWSGSWAPTWSAGGSTVAFLSDTPSAGDTNTGSDVFTQHPVTGVRRAVSTNAGGQFGNNDSGGLRTADGRPVWSPDGTTVLFTSTATNLVPGDTAGADVFAKKPGSGAIAKVSSAATAATPGRWDFGGTWPTYDTVPLTGAAAGSWFRADLWNVTQTKLLVPGTDGQLRAFTVPKQDVPVVSLATPSITTARAGDHAVTLAWRQPAASARVTGYRIQTRAGSGAWHTVVSDTTTATQRRVVAGLRNGTGYQLRVAALGGAKQGSWSVASPRVVPFGEPGRPGRPAVSSVTKKRATLAWDAAAANGAKITYQVQKRKNGTWQPLAVTGTPSWRGKVGRPGADVALRVVAANRAGSGPASRAVTVHLRGR